MGRNRSAIMTLVALAALCFHFNHAHAGQDSNRQHMVIGRTVEYLKGEKVEASETGLKVIARHVYHESKRYDIDYRLVLALMKVESSFKHNAVSHKGAVGLLQIKPSLAKNIARDIGMEWKGASQLREPDKNIKIGIHHLYQLIHAFETLPSALHAYNKGQARAKAEGVRRTAPNARFTGAVLKEYSKNLSLLPDP
jgi:soluble lytic murein transglycosylase